MHQSKIYITNITNLHRPNLYGEVGKIDIDEKLGDDALFRYANIKSQLQSLREYSVRRLLEDFTQDCTIQQHTKAVCDLLQASLQESGFIKNAPDGVRKIVLGSKSANLPVLLIQRALLQANLIKPEDRFASVMDRYGTVLRRPLKIAQITNALLPPLIQNEKKLDKSAFISKQENSNRNLLPLNSCYLQTSIKERQINFILNKVVRAPSSRNSAELFTLQERAVEMNDMMNTTSDIIWSQYQRLELEGYLKAEISCCREHKGIELSLGHYQCFTASIASLINRWVSKQVHVKKVRIHNRSYTVSKQKYSLN